MERIGNQRKRVRIKPGCASRLELLAIPKHGEQRTNELGHEERKRNGNRRDQTLLATQLNRHTAAGEGALLVSSIAMGMLMEILCYVLRLVEPSIDRCELYRGKGIEIFSRRDTSNKDSNGWQTHGSI